MAAAAAATGEWEWEWENGSEDGRHEAYPTTSCLGATPPHARLPPTRTQIAYGSNTYRRLDSCLVRTGVAVAWGVGIVAVLVFGCEPRHGPRGGGLLKSA